MQDFHKAYDQTVAVQGLDFRVEPGQILGLIGPNGAGKTTTLRALAGILPASRGRLRWQVSRFRNRRWRPSEGWRTFRMTRNCFTT